MRYQIKYQLQDHPAGRECRTAKSALRELAKARRAAKAGGDCQGIGVVEIDEAGGWEPVDEIELEARAAEETMGRPLMGAEPRERLNTTVARSTMQAVESEMEAAGMSAGQVIDRWAAEAARKESQK